MEDFQYNKILKRLIRTKSRSYKIGKEKKKKSSRKLHFEGQNL